MLFPRLALGLVVAVALVAGCGKDRDAGATPTPTPSENGVAVLSVNEILDRALQSLRDAGSFRMKGGATDDDVKLEMDLKFRHEDVIGTMTVDGAGLELIKLGDVVYVKPNEAGLKRISEGDESVAAFFRGKWLKGSAKRGNLSSFADVVDLDQLLGPSGGLSKGGPREVNDTPAIGLVDTSANGGTIYVATVGPPYPLRIEGDKSSGAIDFSEFGTPVDIQPPPGNEVIDVDARSRPS